MTIAVAILAVLVGRAIFALLPRAGREDGQEAVRSATGYTLAWLFSAAYLLPWYDSMAWATLPLVDDGPMDFLLVAHTTLLAFAALPGRDLPFPTAYNSVVVALHSVVAPLGLLVVILVTVRLGRRASKLELSAAEALTTNGVHQAAVGIDLDVLTRDAGRPESRSVVEVDGLR